MAKGVEKILETNIHDLTEQLYASYIHTKELSEKNHALEQANAELQSVINGLAYELSEQRRLTQRL